MAQTALLATLTASALILGGIEGAVPVMDDRD
jgi:hypothetical protein